MSSEPQDNGYYVLMNVQGKSFIDLDNGKKDDGTIVHGWNSSFNSVPNQQVWQLQLVPGNGVQRWRIINKQAGSALDLENGNNTKGTTIRCWKKGVHGDDQVWVLNRVGSPGVPRFYIQNVSSGTVVDLANGSSENGTKIQGWEANPDNPNQHWIFLPFN